MKLYVVTADTSIESWGIEITLLRVADNPVDALKSVAYARVNGWIPSIDIIEMNSPVSRTLGFYYE